MTSPIAIAPGAQCFLRAADSRFVTSTQAAGFFLSGDDRRAFFDVEDAGDGRVQIRSAHGDYLCACPDGSVAQAKRASGWEVFSVEDGQGAAVRLRSFHGTYLGARADRGALALFVAPPAAADTLTAIAAFDPAVCGELVRAAPAPGAGAQVVWTFWDRGADNMPPFYKLNVEGWRRRLGPAWRVEVVNVVPGDPRHVDNFVARADLPASFDALSPVVQSDAVRLALLARHGGVWMDAGIVLVAGLDEIGWRALVDPAADTVLAGFYNDAWGSDHLGRRDCVESWFVAARPRDAFVGAWHRAFVDYWTDRTASTESWTHPLFERLDLSSFARHGADFRNYLIVSIAFRRLLEHDPHMRALWRHNMLLRHAGDEAFYLTQVVGWEARRIRQKLVRERDDRLVEALLARPLMKFTSSMSVDLRGLSEDALLDPGHTLGQIYARVLGGQTKTALDRDIERRR